MAKRRTGSRKPRASAPSRRRAQPSRPPSLDDLAAVVVRGGDELLTVEDPLDAESWASQMLGTFYKVGGPLEARDELDRGLLPAVVAQAEARGDAGGIAVLEAIAAVIDDPDHAELARDAAGRLQSRGIPAPSWASELGTVVFDGAWVLEDVYGDHEAYFATFRYPGRKPHIVNALYDRAMGEIIKDAMVAYPVEDIRARVSGEDGVFARDVEPGEMARRISDAIASGDMFLDNDWTSDFKEFRLLVLARMRGLPLSPEVAPPDPLDDDARDALIADFLTTGSVGDLDQADVIASTCLDYLCDYLGDDPFRWSPIVVEMFLLDYLPRKVSLDMPTIDQTPRVLREWVRFALTKRGLEERWIVETQAAVDEHARAFRSAMTDADRFGPAKQLVNEMLADGVDLSDPASFERWIADYNERQTLDR